MLEKSRIEIGKPVSVGREGMFGKKMRLSDPQDQEFVTALFPRRYRCLIPAFIDERSPEIKRAEFNKMRKHLCKYLSRTESNTCQLNFDGCDPSRGFDVDHLIPLSSNVLNKLIRNKQAEPGRKVPAQSIGSNNPLNLILACKACNGHKKHNLVSTEEMEAILERKFGAARVEDAKPDHVAS